MRVARRLSALDAVRAFAVLIVIGYHTAYRFPPVDGDVAGRFLRVTGWMGVDLFFALSGFLVGGILASEKSRTDISGFFRKRMFRIIPIFVVAVTVFGLGDLLIKGGGELGKLWKPFFFLTGYLLPFQGEAQVPYTITWSLSVEVTAYILLGMLAWLAWARFAAVLVAIVLISPLLRIWLAYGAGWDEAAIGVFPPARLDAIAFGALAAVGRFDRLLAIPSAALVYGVLTVGIILAFRYAAWIPPFISTIGYSLFGISAALWVATLARTTRTAGPVIVALARVGLVSYFMYLFHLFFIEALGIADRTLGLELGFWPAFGAGTAITFAAGLASWRWFEYPLIRFAGGKPLRSASAVS